MEFLGRPGSGRSRGIGVDAVRRWARSLPRGATVIDLGCGLTGVNYFFALTTTISPYQRQLLFSSSAERSDRRRPGCFA